MGRSERTNSNGEKLSDVMLELHEKRVKSKIC